ncbi:ABC transporter ATP-binding protein [Enterococcus faecalis]|uniref:ABC transporter ATP-binding protein n=1 Tax=Enterococcus faecalis TaxID=1351 RepID=UPI0031CD0476
MVLQVKNLYHKYGEQQVLKAVNCQFFEGEMYAIVGKSGSGKTTLLSLIAGLDTVQKGEVLFQGQMLGNLTRYRRKNSIIFQSYNLISYLTPIENVLIALEIDGIKKNKKAIAIDYLNQVGVVGELQEKKCSQLSGGQQQRVAIARTLASDSKIIFADEPTGNLDSKTANEIINIFKDLASIHNKCIICVTHDQHVEEFADKIYTLKDGVLKA